MGTSVKTVQYAFEALASLTDNTLTALTPITITLPESSISFVTVLCTISADDIITVTGGSITTRQIDLGLGGGTQTTITNTNTVTNSGENISLFISQDFTDRFTSDWTGTSMTCEVSVKTVQSTGTTLGFANVCCTLDITYEYDDTSATQVKTVWLPLNAPVGALATSKPGTATATIPALDTHLPEATKSFKQINIWRIANTGQTAVTDCTVSHQVDSIAATTATYEGALATSRLVRFIDTTSTSGMDTSITHGFYIWADLAVFNHSMIWMQITYTFDASTTTSAFVSIKIPMEISSPMAATTEDFQRGIREFFIPESNIVGKELAYYCFYESIAAIAGLSFRIGTGAFIAYTDLGSFNAGSCCAMVRNDSAFTLTRGRNSFNFDCYRTDSVDLGWGISGFWIINYTADVPSQGISAMNKTVIKSLQAQGTNAANDEITVNALAFNIPESNYFLNSVGLENFVLTNTAGNSSNVIVQMERLVAEGGTQWEPILYDIGQWDLEVGMKIQYATGRTYFQRWPGDNFQDSSRVDLETNRKWKIIMANASTGWCDLRLLVTYHSIYFSVTGNIYGSGGGTVTLNLHRETSGEIVYQTTRVGDGEYTINWYDNTENVFVSAYEDNNHLGRSVSALAGT